MTGMVRQPAVAHVHQVSLSAGGVPKHAVPAAQVTRNGLAGDRQRNRKIHGGPDRAVCLYSMEVIHTLRAEGHSIGPGSAGENVTIAGLDWARLVPGDRLFLGDQVQLEITSYTSPCRVNGQWFKDGNFERMAQDSHPGSSRLYARVLAEGIVRQGDQVRVHHLDAKMEVE